MTGLLGVAAHRQLPEGEDLGTTFQHGGQTYYVTQRELDRIRSIPPVEKVREMVAQVEALLGRG